MATAKSAHGVLLKKGNGGSPETFTTIAKVRDISGPSISMTAIDVTSQDSTGHYMEKIGGLIDPGQVTFDIVWDPADATHGVSTGLLDDLRDRTLRNFQVVWTDALSTTWSFSALVTNFSPSASMDGALMASVTLDLSGQITLA